MHHVCFFESHRKSRISVFRRSVVERDTRNSDGDTMSFVAFRLPSMNTILLREYASLEQADVVPIPRGGGGRRGRRLQQRQHGNEIM